MAVITYGVRNQVAETPPTAPISNSTSPTGGDPGSVGGLNAGSLTYDDNSGCVRLTPLLSWNYTSTLDQGSYWYERATDVADANGNLLRGHAYQTVKLQDQSGASTANQVGNPTVVLNSSNSSPTAVSPTTTTTKLYNKIQGLGYVRRYNFTYIDNQSSRQTNHNSNIWTPDSGNNANLFKEYIINELGIVGNTGTKVPKLFLKTNLDFMKAGQDPSLVAFNSNKYNQQNENLDTEYGITSNFSLPENSAFAIALHPFGSYGKMAGNTGSPKGKPYVRVYWGGKYCFQYEDTGEAHFCPDTTRGDKSEWVFESVEGLNLSSADSQTLIVLLFEVVGMSIVISNMSDLGNRDPKVKNPSWGYTDLNSLQADSVGLTVHSGKINIGIRGIDTAFTYVPVVYPNTGKMKVANLQTGYSTTGLRVSNTVDTSTIMGGSVVASPDGVGDGSFGYSITVTRESTVDKSPAVVSVELVSDAAYTSIGVNSFQTTNRVRKVDARLGLENQDGSILLDNRDGRLSDVGGVLPCSISVGWNNQNTTLFNGFITTSATNKTPASSTVEFSLVGSDLILKDAIAVNLPIYDGWQDGEAVQDMLNRSSWPQSKNIIGTYQLPVPGILTSPAYMFPMGRPIMDCIRDIAAAAGAWAYVDNFGVFNYIPINIGHGNFLQSFNEVPNLNSYNEWQTLSGVKDSSEVRNAVLIVGLTPFTDWPSPIVSLRTADNSSVGNFMGTNIIPWFRWYVRQDPKLNSQSVCDMIAEQYFQNLNRLRLTTSGSVWGNPVLVPWHKIGINLAIDNIGIPSGAQWRIITALHSLDADTGNYTTSLECEYVDPRYSYASWWEQ